MRRPALALAALVAAILAPVAPGAGALPDEAPTAAVERYLNDIDTLRAPFVQIAPDGSQSTGSFYFERPDKMRLDYDPPSEILIVANGFEVTYYDRRLDQVSQLLTSATPLGFLLDDRIRLDGEVTVTDVRRQWGELSITVIETAEPEQGQVTLTFDEAPLQLRRWAVTDAQGLTTHILLQEVESGVALDDELFRFRKSARHRD